MLSLQLGEAGLIYGRGECGQVLYHTTRPQPSVINKHNLTNNIKWFIVIAWTTLSCALTMDGFKVSTTVGALYCTARMHTIMEFM